MSGDVFLNIDRIVLHGMDHVDGKALAAAMQQSLLEQLAANSISHPAAAARVRTEITLPKSCDTEQMGRVLAQSLYGVISNNTATARRGRTGGRRGRGDA